jgi:hypothetical protein
VSMMSRMFRTRTRSIYATFVDHDQRESRSFPRVYVFSSSFFLPEDGLDENKKLSSL